MFASLLNLTVYSPLEYAFYGAGGALWITVYLIILFQARKKEFVGAPALVMWAFMSWEILWGFVYKTDLDSLFIWLLRLLPDEDVGGAPAVAAGHAQAGAPGAGGPARALRVVDSASSSKAMAA